MTIDSAAMGWIVPLFLGIVGGIAWLIVWVVKLSIKVTSLEKDDEILKSEAKEHREHNQRQHDELYQSRNNANVTLERLTTLFENMDKKLDELLKRGVN